MKKSLFLLIITGIVIMVFGSGGCCAQPFTSDISTSEPNETYNEPPKYPDLSADRFGPNLNIDVIPDKNFYLPASGETYYYPGEEITWNIHFLNNNKYPIVIHPFPPEIRIFTNELGEKLVIREFIEIGQVINLSPDETKTFIVNWDQKDDDGRPVTAGKYYGVEISGSWVGTTLESGSPINRTSGGVLIQHPQGAMEKVIEVNQSKTVYNLPLPTSTNIFTSVTMTMQRIEITPDGVWIYCLATSPDSLRGFPGISFGGTPAQYSVDDMVKTKKNTGGGLLEDNVRLLIWEYIEPFPVDAKELIFKIIRFGEWEGPWEFHIPLQ